MEKARRIDARPAHLDGQVRTTRPAAIGPEEGVGQLLRHGAFVSSVRYTLVTVEQQPASDSGGRPSYTGVLRFEATASAIAEQLRCPDHVFELEIVGGQRLSCRPVEPLGSGGLRWIVRLT
jgi:hypothetical protein